MHGKGHVSLEDFELLKVLGTGGKRYMYTCKYMLDVYDGVDKFLRSLK